MGVNYQRIPPCSSEGPVSPVGLHLPFAVAPRSRRLGPLVETGYFSDGPVDLVGLRGSGRPPRPPGRQQVLGSIEEVNHNVVASSRLSSIVAVKTLRRLSAIAAADSPVVDTADCRAPGPGIPGRPAARGRNVAPPLWPGPLAVTDSAVAGNPAIVQQVANRTTQTTPSVTNWTVATTAGNTLYCGVLTSSTGTLSLGAGWTLYASIAWGTGTVLQHWHYLSAPSQTSFTATSTGGNALMVCSACEIGGLVSNAVDVAASNSGTGTALSCGPTLATAGLGEIVIVTLNINLVIAGTSLTLNSPAFTELAFVASSVQLKEFSYYDILASSATPSISWTCSASRAWAAQMVVYK